MSTIFYMGNLDNEHFNNTYVYDPNHSSIDLEFSSPPENVYGMSCQEYINYMLSSTTYGGSKKGTRFGLCKDYVFEPSTTNNPGTDDFERHNVSIFCPKECCTRYNSSTGKQEVVSYEGDPTWDTDKINPEYNRMIEFPKFYYDRTCLHELWVSPTPVTGCTKPSPMHYRNGKLYDYVYISKYHLNSNYRSVTGTTPVNSKNIATLRTNTRAQGMYIMDYPAASSIIMLMLIKYATIDVQTVIGYGLSNRSATGLADSVLSKDGRVGSATNTTSATVAFGLENWWGNYSTLVDGIFKNTSNKLIINEDIENITENPDTVTYTGYTEIPTAPATSSMNIKEGMLDEQFPYIMVAVPVSNSSYANGTSDYYHYKSGFTCICIGSYGGQGTKMGPLTVDASTTSLTSTLATVSIRGMFFSSTYS